MRVLFTGSSSFTGVWFIRELARRGHEVVATFRRQLDGYEGTRAERVAIVAEVAEARFGISFGDEAFVSLLAAGFDVLCHHGAEATDYRSPDFDVAAAFAANTRNVAAVMAGVPRTVLTGTVFEQREGAGERPLRAFSPYGLSKGLTADAFAFHAHQTGRDLLKFVIPNPFGPYEEARFTSYLASSWLAGRRPRVAAPAYVRDNIHVSRLAKTYARFVERGEGRLAPTGYVETQEAFARRFARELEPRLGVACPLEIAEQTDFPEPVVRINTDRVDVDDWSEPAAWDELASYYERAARAWTEG